MWPPLGPGGRYAIKPDSELMGGEKKGAINELPGVV